MKIIANYENIYKTYKFEIPEKKLAQLKHRKWFPLKHESDLAIDSAYLIGKIIGDGNLDKKFTCRFVGNFEELLNLKNLIKESYLIDSKSLKIKFRTARGESYLLQVNDSLLGRLLYLLGAPIGNKTKTKFNIPKWIYTSNFYKKSFLQGIFEDELSTIKIKREKYLREGTFRMAKINKYQEDLNNFLSEIIFLTNCFDVKCSQIGKPHLENIKENGNDTYSQCFRILGNLNNMIKFKENIGFRFNQDKIRLLDTSIEKIKIMRGVGFEFVQSHNSAPTVPRKH